MKDSGTAPAMAHDLRTYSLPSSPPVAPFPDQASQRISNRSNPALDADLLLAQENWVRAVARHLVRDPGRAEDVAQETMLAALQSPPRDAEDPRRLRAWLGRVAHNLAHLDTRRRMRQQAREERVAQSESLRSAADGVLHNSILHEVELAVSELEEPYQSAVRARYFDGKSTQEIATATFTTDNAVRKRLWRAREKLRLILDRRHNGERLAWFNALGPELGLALGKLTQTGLSQTATATSGSQGTLGHTAVGTCKAGTPSASIGAAWKLAAALPLVAAGALGLTLLSNEDVVQLDGASDSRIVLAGERIPVAFPSTAGAQDATVAHAEIATLMQQGDEEQFSRRSQADDASGEGADRANADGDSLDQLEAFRPDLTGRVLHILDGQGVANVSIGWRVRNEDGHEEPLVVGTTDEEGNLHAVLPSERPDGLNATNLIVLDENLSTLRRGQISLDRSEAEEASQTAPSEGATPISELVFVVADAVDVAGRVLDPQGVPVAGAEVALILEDNIYLPLDVPLDRTQPFVFKTVTDTGGAFSLSGLPSGEGTLLRVTPADQSLGREPGAVTFRADDGNALTLKSTEFAVPPFGDVALVISLERMPPAPITLSGSVWLANHEPARTATVSLGRFSTRTDHAGRYELRVDERVDPRADLRASQEGWVEAYVPDFGRELVQTERVDRRSEVSLTLAERARTVEGYVEAQEVGFGWQLGSAGGNDLPRIDQRDSQNQPRGSNSPTIDGNLAEGNGDGDFNGMGTGGESAQAAPPGGLRNGPRDDDPQDDPPSGDIDDDGGFDFAGFDRRRGRRWVQGIDPDSGRTFRAGPILPGDTPTLLDFVPVDPRPTLRGKLIDEQGKPVDGARVGVSVLLGFEPGPAAPPQEPKDGIDPHSRPIRWDSPDTVLTDRAGEFALDQVPAQFCDLRIDHPDLGLVLVPLPDAVGGQDSLRPDRPLAGPLDEREVTIVTVSRLVAFRVRVDAYPTAQAFRLEDEQGRDLLLVGADSEGWTAPLQRGPHGAESAVFRAPSRASTLVLLDPAGEVLARSGLELPTERQEPVLLVP